MGILFGALLLSPFLFFFLGGGAVEPLSVIWDRPIWKAQALDRSLPCRRDIAGRRQAEARWSRLNRGLATSLPWSLREADGLLG